MPRYLDRWVACGSLLLSSTLIALAPASADEPLAAAASTSVNLGPYNLTVLEGGIGMQRALDPNAVSAAGASWSLTGWVRSTRRQSGTVIVAAIGDVDATRSAWRGVLLLDGELALVLSPSSTLRSGAELDPGRWYAIAATYDGTTARLYLDGRECAAAAASTLSVAPRILLAPTSVNREGVEVPHFGGSLAEFTLAPTALAARTVKSLWAARPDFSLVTFDAIGVGWPLQEHAWRGLQEPQDPWTLPKAKSALSAPEAEPPPAVGSGLSMQRAGSWTLDAWRLRAAPEVLADGAQLSQAEYIERQWYTAVVPGTVLTTLIARGVYPDPDYGLNNLAIPDSLSRQDYWYRTVFPAPADLRDRELTLTFNGINYAAEVWLNGQRLGEIRGAFIRGVFDVTGTGATRPAQRPRRAHLTAAASRVFRTNNRLRPVPARTAGRSPSMARPSSPPRVGIGFRVFATATSVYGRASSSKRPAACASSTLTSSLTCRCREPTAPTSRSPCRSRIDALLRSAATLIARLDDVSVHKSVTLPPGMTIVALDPHEFPQLHLHRA